MTTSLIVAVSQNGVIGKNNQLPWHLPADLKHFKQLTMGHPILMGRKTFESIGKPLPGRTNIVITHQDHFACCGAVTAPSLEKALELGANEPEVFIIGGAAIFKQAMPLADKLYLTLIHKDFEGDAYFTWNKSDWTEVSREDHTGSDSPPFSFITLQKA